MKPTSLARSIAARQNGAKSRGPVTPEGKRVSSMNALRHGLTAKTLLLPGESEDRFHFHHQSIHHDLAPSNYLEEFVVNRVATAAWKLLRADSHEAGLVRDQLSQTDPRPDTATTIARAWADSPAWQATLYESRHQRNFQQSLQTFFDLTLLRREPSGDTIAEEIQEDPAGNPQVSNEPEAEIAPPECGDRAA